jgi:hypothetical protein
MTDDAPTYNIKSWRLKRILTGPQPEPMSLAELERLSKRGGFRVETKQQRRKREQLGTRLAKAKKAARRRRQREARAALALLGGKDARRAEIARQTWQRRLRPPIGSLATDRVVIAAMSDWPSPPAWLTLRQICERVDWARLPARRTRPASRLGRPLTRLMAHGIVEKVRGENYRGRVATHHYRLTSDGASLSEEIELRLIPEQRSWRSMRVSPRPVGDSSGEAKVLCAMAPGQWWSIGDICRALGLSWRHKLERQAIDNALRRHLVPAGAVEKAQNPDWQGPGPEEPRFLYQLTRRGKQAREGLMLIG